MAGLLKFEGPYLTKFNRKVLDYEIVGVASKLAGERAVRYAREELARSGINDHGALSSSLKSKVTYTPLGPEFTVYSDQSMTWGLPVALWVNDGTGIHNEPALGPPGAGVITPKNFSVLKFVPGKRSTYSTRGYKGKGGLVQFSNPGSVYSASVQGQKATHFLEHAFSRIRVIDFIA